jgi:hypothetical protein
MWGIVYQGYNATFPSFYQELFPTRTRVTAFAVSQNIGTVITSFLPLIYAAITTADSNVPLIVGTFTFGCGIICAASAFSAKETYMIHMNDLGEKDAQPVSPEEYARVRELAMAGRKTAG